MNSRKQGQGVNVLCEGLRTAGRLQVRARLNDDAERNILSSRHRPNVEIRIVCKEVVVKCRQLMQRYETKSKNILFSDVVPRISADNFYYSKNSSSNNRLINLCLQEHGIDFIKRQSAPEERLTRL